MSAWICRLSAAVARLFRRLGLDPFSAPRARPVPQNFQCAPVIICDQVRGLCPECLAEPDGGASAS
jgi:hypothetical protein